MKVFLRIPPGVEVFLHTLQALKKMIEGIKREYEERVDLRRRRLILRRVRLNRVDCGQRRWSKREEEHDNDGRGLCLVDQKVRKVDMDDITQKSVFVGLRLMRKLLDEGRQPHLDEEDHLPLFDEDHHLL